MCFDPNAIYDEAYYRSGLGPSPYQRDATWLGFFGAVADQLVRTFAPKTALDVGCAMGMLVESLWDRGVVAEGIDVSQYALSCVRPDMRAHCRYGSLVDGVEGRYDLVTCIEVLEHIPAEQTEVAIRNLCALGDTIVFSSSPIDFEEPTHINVRPPLEWLQLFAANGFRVALAVDGSFIAPHVLVFRRAEAYAAADVDGFVSRTVGLRLALAERDNGNDALPPGYEADLARCEALRAEHDTLARERDAAQARCDQLQSALDALDANAAELRRMLLAAQAGRDEALDGLRRATRDRGVVRGELATPHGALTALRAELDAERARTAGAAARAASLANDVERLRNAQLLDRLRRGDDASAVRQLRELEERYARLSEAYVARGPAV